jgi:CIC family chloride channel protein
VIGPALLIGSWLGAAYGAVVVQVLPGVEVSPTALAMVATAAMLAATFHAPLFGTMMVFEMVGDVRFLVPLILGAALAYGIARLFQPGSAYTFGFQAAGRQLRAGHVRGAERGSGASAGLTPGR